MSAAAVALGEIQTAAAQTVWDGFAGNPQHTALAPVPTDSLQTVRWSTPVDTSYSGGSGPIYIHYGSPAVTADNTVIVPVKTTATGGFTVQAVNGSTGSTIWKSASDYTFPTPYGWTPSYSPVVTPANVLYYPAAGGTVDYHDDADSPTGATGQIPFYTSEANYQSNPTAYSGIAIDTPLTTDSSGDIYFGYRVDNPADAPAGLTDGIARIAPNGVGTYMTVASITSNPTVSSSMAPGVDTVLMNSAPALSNNGQTLYVAMSNGPNALSGRGDLVALNALTLTPTAAVELKDPTNGLLASLPDDGTASPMVAPDGNVFMGTLANNYYANDYRGYMLQFNGSLSQTLTPGLFGWDDTASIVPKSMVPGYAGSSPYLIMTKYNNYYNNGSGLNELAILDPNGSQIVNGVSYMSEVETVLGKTPDPAGEAAGDPGAVKEWCINSALVDPATDSVIANSEDGNVYRWNLGTNTLSEMVNLTNGVGEAYTPTLEGADGSVFAIQDGVLFNIVPEPASAALICLGGLILARRRPRRA